MALHTSDPIPGYYGGEVKVTARPAESGQPAEVVLKERGVEVLSLRTDAARALADALQTAADRAENRTAG